MLLRTRSLILALIASVSVLTIAAGAQNDRRGDDKTLSPYFFVEGGDPSIDHLPLKDTRVSVAISGVIADVTVQQVYENHGSRPLHARYVFPASTRAAVYGLTMTVGDVRTVATIKERQQAAQEFEAAKREGKSASLLEQSRANVFSMRVANVMPGDSIAVELHYTELLVPTDGVYEFVYPTVVGPRYSETPQGQASAADHFVSSAYTHSGEAPRSEFHLAGVVSTGVPLQDLSSPTHRLVVCATEPGRADIALANDDPFTGNRDFILRYRLAGEEISSGLLLYKSRDENFFLLMAQPPRTVESNEMPGREYVFVLDVSGSMSGYPLDTAKELMRELTNVLRPTDAFNVVVFESGTDTFVPTSVPATSENVTRALRFIGSKSGGGGTRLLNALQRAIALPRQPATSRSVVLVTDGYIDAEADVFDYIREQRDDLNVFAFGIGSSVNRLLVEGVAQSGLGEPFVVTDPTEAKAAATQLRHYIDSPALTGIDVQFRGFDAYDVEPGAVPDLFASRPVVVFGKWRGNPTGSIEITGNTGRGPYHASVSVSASSADDSHAALRYLWARHRIAELSDYGVANPGPDNVAAITSLGLTYSLLTKYTSFIAVQEIVRRTTDDATDVDQPLPMPQGVSDHAVGVTSGAEPEMVWLAAIALALFGLTRLLRARPRRSGAAA
jgi:Ca-activated chloride channel family protein